MSELEVYSDLKDFEELRPYLEGDLDQFESKFSEPEFAPDFSNILTVDGLPLVNQDKRAKLLSIVFKLYSQFNSKLNEAEDIVMPADAAGVSLGFCYVKLPTSADAANAMAKTQGFQLSKSNSFKVSFYAVDTTTVNTNFVAPPNLSEWLCDTHGRDQFVLRYGRDTELFWANTASGEEPNMVYGGEREKEGGKVWCERQVSFSPQGTYFVTFHSPGIKLWGGLKFEAQGRFLHNNVETMEFSPCEKYIVTYSSDPSTGYGNTGPVENIIVWSVETGAKLRAFTHKNSLDAKMIVQAIVTEETKGKKVERSFRGRVVSYNASKYTYSVSEGSVVHHGIESDKIQALQNPNILKWSHDGKYLARLSADAIQVYDMPTVQLLEKKSFAAKDMLNFCWSPKQNMLSYWSPSTGNLPAMINIVGVDRKEFCSRKCFDVLEGRMQWQSDGEYLCVYMTKQQGKKRSYVVMFFRVKEAGVPVELIELTEPIINVRWEPSGDRVAIVHGDSKSATVSFYSMFGQPASGNKKSGSNIPIKELTLLHTLANTPCTEVIWSPAGNICAVAYFVSGDSCSFNLYDVDGANSLATRRHERCTGLYWDPSGRVLASVTTSPMINGNIIKGAPLQVEDSYNLWSFQGTPICVVRKEKLYNFIWRPRPSFIISTEEKKNIIKNLKKYEKIFEREDKIRKAEIYQEATAKRNSIAADFLSLVSKRKEEIKQKFGSSWKILVRNGFDDEDDSHYDIVSKVRDMVFTYDVIYSGCDIIYILYTIYYIFFI